MSALSLDDSALDTTATFLVSSTRLVSSARVGFVIASLATGLAVLVIVDHLKGTGAPSASPEPRRVISTGPIGGAFSAIGLAARPHAFDPIADFMRHGLVPDARSPKGWVPETISSPDICRLPRPDVRWSIASARDPLKRRAAASRRGHTTRRHRLGHIQEKFATLDGTLRFQLSSGFQASNGYATPVNAISAFEALPPLDVAELAIPGAVTQDAIHGLGNPMASAENRRAVPIGTAASVLQFDDRPGQISAAAQAGLWNGTPATAMGVGYTLPNRIRLDATGVTNVNTWTNVGKAFQVSTVASIPLD